MIDTGRIAAAWDSADGDRPEATVAFFARLIEEHPDDPRARFEYASALDFAGREADAAPEYERAMAGGLEADIGRQATIQYASTLRNLGRSAEAVELLQAATQRYPDDGAVAAFLALSLSSAGRDSEAVRLLLELAVERVDDPSLRQYGRAIRAYAAELTDGPAE